MKTRTRCETCSCFFIPLSSSKLIYNQLENPRPYIKRYNPLSKLYPSSAQSTLFSHL